MKLYVCFLASNSELLESHVLNRAAAWLISAEHPMIHAEVLFADDTSQEDISGYACSIHYGGEVFLQRKSFRRVDWKFRRVPCSDEKVDAAFEFCQDHVGDRFNYVGYYTHPFCTPRLTENRWFCSEIVAGALNVAGVEVGKSMHPHKLYEALVDVTVPSCPRQVALTF